MGPQNPKSAMLTLRPQGRFLSGQKILYLIIHGGRHDDPLLGGGNQLEINLGRIGLTNCWQNLGGQVWEKVPPQYLSDIIYITISTFMSVRLYGIIGILSHPTLQFLQSDHKMSLMKVAWFELTNRNIHFGSSSDLQGP